MAGVSAFLAKAYLDWALQGATPTRPAAMFIGFATATPNATSDFAGPVVRKTCTFGAASTQGSPTATASNRAAISCTATAICTLVGFNLYDATSSGNRLMWGTLTATLGCASADVPAFAAGGLTVIMS